MTGYGPIRCGRFGVKNARVVKKIGKKETPLGEKATKVGEKVNFVGEKKFIHHISDLNAKTDLLLNKRCDTCGSDY